MLETKRLKLIAFEKLDARLFSGWETSPAVQKYFFANPYSLPQPEKDSELFDWWLEEMAKSKCGFYKVLLKRGAESRRLRASSWARC